MQDQVEALRTIWHDLATQVQVHQTHVLALLQERLQSAIGTVNGLNIAKLNVETSLKRLLNTRGDVRKVKYALHTKPKLEKIVRNLEDWHRRFDPSWYLLARIAPAAIEQQRPTMRQADPSKELAIIQELRKVHRMNREPLNTQDSVFLPAEFSIEALQGITNSYAKTGLAEQHIIIVDSFRIPIGIDVQTAARDVRDIARILARIDPTVFSLLVCRGVMGTFDSLRNIIGFDFVFELPSGFGHPDSLRSFLLAASSTYPLDERFRLAKLLARAVSLIHSSQMLHKNISPETILLLEDSATGLSSPFLVGFEKFRRADTVTNKTGDLFWEKNLYRHPQRQGQHPEEEYKMQHDIYSLGVCLLEIGLGESFVYFEANATSNQNPRGAVPGAILGAGDYINTKDIRARAAHFKKILINAAEDRLPAKMGMVYTNVVLACLTCLDTGNQAFGDVMELMEEDGVAVGIRYIEKILYQIEEIKF